MGLARLGPPLYQRQFLMPFAIGHWLSRLRRRRPFQFDISLRKGDELMRNAFRMILFQQDI
jgi:hypothetical protein